MNQPFHRAYLGKRMQDFMELAHEQMTDVYVQKGLKIPVQGSSTLQALNPGSRQSLSDLARILHQPHQLVSQRIERLLKAGLVTRTPDPSDKRRSEYSLTSEGEDQWRLLNEVMEDVDMVHAELFAELGVDLLKVMDDAIAKISDNGLHERIFSLKGKEQ